MIKKLLHTRMRVNDIEKSIRFYVDALGLKLARTGVSPRGARLAFLQTPGSDEEIELCQMPGAAAPVSVQPDLVHLAFQVDDLRAFAGALAKKGVGLTDGPVQTEAGDTIAFIDAPEGYEVELIQPA
jgi:lactoylglutathione lyase